MIAESDKPKHPAQTVSFPRFLMLRTQPVIFSPIDPHVLFFAAKHTLENTRWRQT